MSNPWILLFFLFPTIIFSQKQTLPRDVAEAIESRIQFGHNPSIVVGIIDLNGHAYYSFGNRRIDGKPADEHSIYEIGSITKVFTAILLADNIIKGKMSPDDPLTKYLPSTVTVPSFDGMPITLAQLSDHTSSLPRLPSNLAPADPTNPYADYTVEQMYSFLAEHELQRPIGSLYEYSNLAVGLLGHILALHAGSSYEELIKARIAGPLDMHETGILLTEKMKKHLAVGHHMGIEVPNWDLPALAGAGGIRSSVHDMLLFLAANLGIKDTPLREAMQLSHMVRHDKAGGSRVGLGWHIDKGSEGDVFWHNGGTGGYRTFAGFVRETGKGVVVFTNSDESVDDIGFHLLDPQSKLKIVKPHIAGVLREVIESEGSSGLMEKYKVYREGEGDHYDFSENAINSLGYYYLHQQKIDAALAIFRINMMEYPASFNVYDSYGEALMKNGQKEEAILNYKKSLELNPGNTNAIDMLASMGVVYTPAEVTVAQEILDSYTGIYELVPGFNIEITREGSQLFGQATGQPQFELFPKSEQEFYLKVVEARIVFKPNVEGIMGLTLFQGGQVLPGRKL